MSLIEVAKTNEIEEGTIKPVNVEEKEIMIARYHGDYYALEKNCTHKGGDLSRGKLDGKIVTCPLHASRFDITTGKNISGPKIGFIKLKTGDLKTYEVKVEGDSIMVDI
jgi:3-phenylpropionate/trans-cinnamate dioxygenase ferredoxin component